MKINKIFIFPILAVFASLILTTSIQAVTFTVDRTDDATVQTCTALANDCTLRGAIAAANTALTDDVIDFDATVFNTQQTIVLSGTQLQINTNTVLTINGPGATLLTISGNNASRVFNIQAGATVELNGLTISEGFQSGDGGGILAIGNNIMLTLNNSVISNNGSATNSINGGGINFGSSNPAINSGSLLTINNSTISDNKATLGSGTGIRVIGASLDLNNSIVSNNIGGGSSGAGISVGNNFSTFTMDNTSVTGNTGGNGSGVFISGSGASTLTDSTINGNSTTIPSSNGGGISIGSTGSLDIIRTTISNNTSATLDGGGIYIFGTNNVNITETTISGNQTLRNGGGIWGTSGSTVTLSNSTVSGNSGTSANSQGGGIYGVQNSISLNSVTLSNNSVPGANNGGGINIIGAAAVTTLNNTIIANSTNGDCVRNGSTINASYSLIEDNLTCVTGTNSNNLTGDPNLGPLANNGGPTQTHAPFAGSIVIDTGNSLLTTDQRGMMRPINEPNSPNGTGNLADIGAVEVLAPTAANVSVSGRVLSSDKGRGVPNAVVYITDQDGNTRTARTNMFGYFRFNDVEVGQSLIFNVYHKSYQFTTRVVTVDDNLTDLIFTPQADTIMRRRW